jgi:hypothetical protein
MKEWIIGMSSPSQIPKRRNSRAKLSRSRKSSALIWNDIQRSSRKEPGAGGPPSDSTKILLCGCVRRCELHWWVPTQHASFSTYGNNQKQIAVTLALLPTANLNKNNHISTIRRHEAVLKESDWEDVQDPSIKVPSHLLWPTKARGKRMMRTLISHTRHADRDETSADEDKWVYWPSICFRLRYVSVIVESSCLCH